MDMADHRGQPCAVIGELRDPPHYFPFMRPDTPLGADTMRRLNLTLGLWCAAIATLLALFARMTGLATRAIGPMPGWVFALCIVLFGSSLLGFFVARGLTRAHWKAAGRVEAARLLAARGQCPSCAAWLITTPPDADRRTTCHACQAAWKVGNTEGCPGCGYDMSAVPATAGPLAICPECATLSAANVGADGACGGPA